MSQTALPLAVAPFGVRPMTRAPAAQPVRAHAAPGLRTLRPVIGFAWRRHVVIADMPARARYAWALRHGARATVAPVLGAHGPRRGPTGAPVDGTQRPGPGGCS